MAKTKSAEQEVVTKKKTASTSKAPVVAKKKKNNFDGLIEVITSKLWKGIDEISVDELKFLDIDTSENEIRIDNTNMILEKKFFQNSVYSISAIDKSRNLFGIPLADNEELLIGLQEAYERNGGNGGISNVNLLKGFIKTDLFKFEVGNFQLDKAVSFSITDLFSGGYNFKLKDQEKDAYGKWVDSSVDSNKVKYVLSLYKFSKRRLSTIKEVDWNAELEKHFREFFVTAHKKNKYNADLAIGGKRFGLELKLAKQISEDVQKKRSAMAQIEEYKDDFEELMIIVLGSKDDKQERNISELEKKAKKEGIHFYYMTAE